MSLTTHPKVDIERAERVWRDYEGQHDLSSQRGKVAAVDPSTGRVWIGSSGIDVADQMEAEGATAPVYLIRIGSEHFVRKGRH